MQNTIAHHQPTSAQPIPRYRQPTQLMPGFVVQSDQHSFTKAKSCLANLMASYGAVTAAVHKEPLM